MPIPFLHSDYIISSQIRLTIIDIEEITGNVKDTIDLNFVSICAGTYSDSDLQTTKQEVKNLYSGKTDTWKMGATAEFFVHLYMKLIGFKQECLFLNLEEGSIKKGFDGYYSYNGNEWLMESKSGLKGNSSVSHADKVQLAMRDLAKKVSGQETSRKSGIPNNPWKNAYSHANQYDVGTAESIRRNIKKLSNDFINGNFHSIDEFNTIPCGTVFLSGVWNPPRHEDILSSVQAIANMLKGKQIYVICVTNKSVDNFIQYLLS